MAYVEVRMHTELMINVIIKIYVLDSINTDCSFPVYHSVIVCPVWRHKGLPVQKATEDRK